VFFALLIVNNFGVRVLSEMVSALQPPASATAIPEIQAIKLSKKFLIFSSFHTLCKNHYNSHMHASIWLKFVALIGGQKANATIKSWGKSDQHLKEL